MSEPDRMGAVWCDQHERRECSKKSKRSQQRCHAVALAGTATCFSHAGKRREVAKAEGQAITAWSALSGEATVSATDAVLGMLQMSWLRVHLYAGLLEQQVAGDGEATSGGLVGHTYGAAMEVGVYASGEAVRALAQLEAAERDRCVRYAKTAHDMGIAEAQITLAEQQGAMLADAVGKILAALKLTAEQQKRVPEIVPAVLRAIGGGTE